MDCSQTALPPLSSFDFYDGGDSKASFCLPAAPLAIQPSSISDSGESLDSSVTSSSSGSGFSFSSPPFAAAQQLNVSPTTTPRPRVVAGPQQQLPMQRTFDLPAAAVSQTNAPHPPPSGRNMHAKRKSWSPNSDPTSSWIEPARRESGLRTAFYRDVESSRTSPVDSRTPGGTERPSFDFISRNRAWSASSDEATGMDLGVPANSSPIFNVGRQRDSDALRWAADAAQRRLPPADRSAPLRHRHSSYDIRSLLLSSDVASSPVTVVSDLAQLGAGDRRPSLDRRANSDSILDAVSQHPLLPLHPPPVRSISPGGNSDWPLSPSCYDRPHPYRRTHSPAVASSSNVSRLITVSTTHGELSCDSRRAFSRTSKACDTCRSRKTRCTSLEGIRSCVRCDELGQPCVWSEPSKKRGSVTGSGRLRMSRSSTASLPPTSPHSPGSTSGRSPVLTISGWTSAATPGSPMTPSSCLTFDFQALSTKAEVEEEPLPCSGWSQPADQHLQQYRRPPAFARRPRSELFPASFSVAHAGSVAGRNPPNAHHSGPRYQHSTTLAGSGPPFLRPPTDVDDRQLVFLGDNTLTLPPLRIAIGRRPSF